MEIKSKQPTCEARRCKDDIDFIADIPRHGLSVAALRSFVHDRKGKIYLPSEYELKYDPDAVPLRFEELTTAQINGRVVKPETAFQVCSYSEKIADELFDGRSAIGLANVFISHAWSYNFMEVIEAIEAFLVDRKYENEIYFWFDTFVVLQHDRPNTTKRDVTWFASSFKGAIETIHTTLVVMLPWQAPVALTRSWCLWELYSTVASKSEMFIIMSPKQKRGFLDALASDFDKIEVHLSKIDLRNAEAMSLSDKQMIDSAVESLPGGFAYVNKIIHSQLKGWLADCTVEALDLLHNDIPMNAPDAVQLRARLAKLLKQQGKLERAEQHYRLMLSLDLAATSRAVALNGLAHLLREQKQLDEAEPIYREALSLRGTIEESHPLMIESLEGLATLLKNRALRKRAETDRIATDVGESELLRLQVLESFDESERIQNEVYAFYSKQYGETSTQALRVS